MAETRSPLRIIRRESAFAPLFTTSAVLRLLAAMGLGRGVREVRHIAPVGRRQLLLDLVGQRLVAVLDALPLPGRRRAGRQG